MNELEPGPRLEPALKRTEQDVDASLKAVKAANKALKRLKSVIGDGNLREVKAAFTTAEQATSALQQSLTTTSEGWNFDEAAYFGSGAYARELLETANQLNVRIVEQDDSVGMGNNEVSFSITRRLSVPRYGTPSIYTPI